MKKNSDLPAVNSNIGVSMVESFGMFFRHYDYEFLSKLEQEFHIIPKMHIYMVTKVPKIIFLKDKIKIDRKYIYISMKFMDERIDDEVEVRIVNNLLKKDLIIELSPNKDDIEIKDESGNYVLKANAFIFLISYGFTIDCEVVYIGRSFGKDGERTVYKRLKSHSTLQRIYAEKEDDKSIFLSSWQYDRNSISFISPLEEEQNSIDKFKQIFEMSQRPYDLIKKRQEINFTEAALIRYFQPKYNDIMKYNFPSKTHAEYSDLFRENIDYVTVEIDTQRLNVKLFSESVPATYLHNPFYDLNGKRNKYDFFRII